MQQTNTTKKTDNAQLVADLVMTDDTLRLAADLMVTDGTLGLAVNLVMTDDIPPSQWQFLQ